MKCAFCGETMQQSWRYCPACGGTRTNMNDVFSRMHKEMEDMVTDTERTIEAMDIAPFVRAKGGGFSIKIIQTDGKKPQVDIQTFGDIDHEHVQKRVEEQLGITQSPKKRKRKPRMIALHGRMEEPISRVIREDDHVLVDIDLPGVREKDIRVEELESSVEVKAVSKEKSFFKILTKPDDCSLVGREFKNGTLRLSFA